MGALSGLRVIDFGQYIAGPLAAVMLADQGADVIHIDPPGGPRWPVDADAFYNRGKRRITLDLKDEEESAIARGLIRDADVVIENFRPGVMDRLGLGPTRMTALAPALIYCSVPGFAADDPRAGMPAWEGVVAAATDTYITQGQLLAQGDPRLEDPQRPVYTALPLASNFAGFHAATAIVMALIARERDGLGQIIEVPLYDAMFELIGANGISLDGHYRIPRARGASTYACADGRHILFNSSATPRFWRWFAAAAGIDSAEPLPSADLADILMQRPAHEWEQRINAAGGPTTMVRSAAQWLASPQARERETVVCIDDPLLGATWMPGSMVHVSESPGDPHRTRHLPDADHAGILAELPSARSGFRKQVEEQAVSPITTCLEGIRVVDLTQVVAGPCTGRILVEYGADVVKINNPFPESLTAAVSLSGRPTDPGNQQHEHLNRGKRSLLLDLHTQAGQDVVRKLVDRADVVMQNFALGVAQRYGIDYERVQARRPDLVYFSVSAYGYGGPMETFRGFEGNAQAVTGLMHRFGGDGPPLGQPYLLDDYGTGVRGAFAVGLGLYHRLRTGRGQHIDISLAETATYHQAPFLLSYPGKVWNEPAGVRALGSGPLHRLYRARDGWFFVGGSRACLSRVAGLEDVLLNSLNDDSALVCALEERFAAAPVGVWIERLRAGGLGAHQLARVEDLMDDAWVRSHGLSITQTVEGVGEMTMPGVAARLSRTPLRVGKRVRPPGADAAEVLADVGMSADLDRLVAEGAIRTEPPGSLAEAHAASLTS